MASNPKSLQTILGAPGVREKRVTTLTNDGLMDFIQSIVVNEHELKEPFFVLDLGVVVSLMDKWTRSLPTIRPFYAVKCNPEPAFLGALAALGASFDCASRAEIETILSLGVSPDRIIYANPCKAESHLKYAASVGVNLTTFDSKGEIKKIQKHHPKCALLIRIKVDDTHSRYPLGTKFGALPEEVEELLQATQAAGLTVSGVSFHIGCVTTNSLAYHAAIAAAKTVFDVAAQLRMPRMHMLNIGGGFIAGPEFDDAASAIKLALEEYFKNEPELVVIAEPGRYFAEWPFTLATNIIGKRVRGELREYWINDGAYGSMHFVMLYKYESVTAMPLACTSNCAHPCSDSKTYCSTVFGPTCDSLDTVVRSQQLPELQVNDWLVFKNTGAYSTVVGSNFNGFNTSAITTHLAYTNPT